MTGLGAAVTEVDQFEDVPDRPNSYALFPWLIIAVGAASDAINGKFHPAWLAGAGLFLFAVLYIATLWLGLTAGKLRTALVLLGALGVVTVALTAGFGGNMGTLFPLLALCCGAIVPWTSPHGPPLPLVVVFSVACLGALIVWLKHGTSGDVWQVAYGSGLAGLIVSIIFRFINAISELRRTRRELARSAVDAERLRFARDMHDLLGHTLSVMVVKAQVVRRLAERDPAAAAAQAADIEAVGRQALTEVRQAISGYRGRGVAAELATARTALADAGFTVTVRQDGAELPPEADALLGWVIREGVTNVIKHSGGQQCTIEVRNTDEEAAVQIANDGAADHDAAGPHASSPAGRHGGLPAGPHANLPAGRHGGLPAGGHGLAGLTERIAAAGGGLEAGPDTAGGYRLVAVIPAQGPA